MPDIPFNLMRGLPPHPCLPGSLYQLAFPPPLNPVPTLFFSFFLWIFLSPVEPRFDILLSTIVAFVCAKKESLLHRRGSRPGGHLRLGSLNSSTKPPAQNARGSPAHA